MSKRRRTASVNGIVKGAAAEFAALLLLTGVLAAMLQKGMIGPKELTPGLFLVCLTSGSAGVLWGPKGETGNTRRLLACGIPAAIMLIAGYFCFNENGGWDGLILVGCLLLPCLVSVAAGRRKRMRGTTGRKRRGISALR